MKKLKYFLNIGLITLMFATIISCKKLIEVPGNSIGQITTDQVFADSLSAVNAVIGIYTGNLGSRSALSGDVNLFTSLTSDELTSSSPTWQPYINNALVPGSLSAAGGGGGEIWNNAYRSTMIYAANACIEGIDASSTLTPTLKRRLIGECKVIRSLVYFNLTNVFGEVPLVTSTNYTINNMMPRTPVDSVYAQIIRDLNDASSKLSVSYPSAARARPNKYTALALLSKAYLYNKRWKEAETAASTVITSGTYTMESDLSKVFLNGSSEAIWQEPGVSFNPSVTSEGNSFVPFSPLIVPPFYLTTFLKSAFETGDNRNTLWTKTVTIAGKSYSFPYKYKNSNSVSTGKVESYMVLRLAEQYLIRAEARFQLGDLAGGAADLNIIRKRAGLANTIYTNKEDLLIALQHERQTELFCEWGTRWGDLKRTGTINAVLKAEKGDSWPADGHAAFFPIPNDQIRLNPALRQNAGY